MARKLRSKWTVLEEEVVVEVVVEEEEQAASSMSDSIFSVIETFFSKSSIILFSPKNPIFSESTTLSGFFFFLSFNLFLSPQTFREHFLAVTYYNWPTNTS